MKKALLFVFLVNCLAAYAQNRSFKSVSGPSEGGGALAVAVDDVPLAHTSQLLPFNETGELIGKNDLGKQISQVLKNTSVALKEAHSDMNSIVKINVSLSENSLMPEVKRQLAERFKDNMKPAISFVVSNMPHPDALVAMDVIATSSYPVKNKEVKYFRSRKLYSQSMAAHVSILPAGSVAYLSGQAIRGELIPATQEAMSQLKNTLDYLGLKKTDIVQIRSFVNPVTSAAAVEKVIADFFSGSTIPPLVHVEWTSQNPPIEIELIAASPDISPKPAAQLDFLTPPGATHAASLYTRVVRINYGKKLYLSALYGENPGNAETEINGMFKGLTDVLNKTGSDLTHLVKATYYISDSQTSAKLNELRPKYYDAERPPAASKIMVRGTGLEVKTINTDMIAVVKE